jgi:shikimate 5-dehydrogenase
VADKSSARSGQSRLALVVAAGKRHVVLGAAGGTGSAVVRELAAHGLRVRAVTRRGTGDVPEGVEQVAADVGTAEGARRACEGAAVVYHCAQPGTPVSTEPGEIQHLPELGCRRQAVLPPSPRTSLREVPTDLPLTPDRTDLHRV